MIRLRYFLLEHDSNLDQIIEMLSHHPYDDNSGKGFEVISINNGTVEISFFERYSVSEDILLPNGGSEISTRTIYSNYYFHLKFVAERELLLRIYNPPVSIKNLISELSKLIPEFCIRKLAVKPIDIYEQIQKATFVSRFEVPRVVASQIPFGDKAIAAIDVKSPHNAYNDLLKVYEPESFEVERIYIDVRSDDKSMKIRVARTGAVECSESLIATMDSCFLNRLTIDRS